MPKKIIKIAVKILVGILVFAVVALGAGYLYIRQCIIPKYGAALGDISEQGEFLSGKELLGLAKYITDRETIDNIVNFDKESAEELLATMQDADAVQSESAPRASKDAWNKRITAKIEAVPTPAPTPVPTRTPEKAPEEEKPKSGEGATARERIMNTASESEISAGLAILSKISISKVNELRRAGKTAELKAYIQSVLTPAEINKALSLYKKYNHLL